MRVKALKKSVVEVGLYGCTVKSLKTIEYMKHGVWSDFTEQLEVSYLLDDGRVIKDWMPLKAYLKIHQVSGGGYMAMGSEKYAVDVFSNRRVEDVKGTQLCMDRISDMMACCGIPENTNVDINEMVGRKVRIFLGHTENGKYHVKYHKRYE